jgi:hypothetical protein
MAKAVFQRNQRVWVESVGVWGVIEKITPVWARGFDEPIKVTYDLGLGRDFQAHELRPEAETGGDDGEHWRLLRAKNKWQQPGDCLHHPFPGTYPIVVTDVQDWGGWRTPGAEYDRDPLKIERQARLIAKAPALHAIARELVELVAEAPEDAPPAILALAERAAQIERYVRELPEATEPAPTVVTADPAPSGGRLATA